MQPIGGKKKSKKGELVEQVVKLREQQRENRPPDTNKLSEDLSALKIPQLQLLVKELLKVTSLTCCYHLRCERSV